MNPVSSLSTVPMDPVAVLQMTGNAEVTKVAHAVNDRLQRVKALRDRHARQNN